MSYYKQCVLQKGIQVQVVWIPEHLAHKHNFIKLRNKQDKKEWEDGWEVISDSSQAIRLEEEQLFEYESDYKHQRKMSDI